MHRWVLSWPVCILQTCCFDVLLHLTDRNGTGVCSRSPYVCLPHRWAGVIAVTISPLIAREGLPSGPTRALTIGGLGLLR